MTTTMRASAREMRHMVGRYLHARRCPGYAVNAIRDAIMAAQAEGYDAVTRMEEIREAYADARTGFAVRASETGLVLDGAGTPAAILAPAFVDELALAAAAGPATVRVEGVPGVAMLAALGEYAAVRGVAFRLHADGDDTATATAERVTATPVVPAESAAGPAMRRILLEGYEMDAEQFWRLFHESNEALTPDSELSRRHAGSQLYDEDGNLLGEAGEETYVHLRSESGGSAVPA
ncbi:hypothetical protein MUN78_13605 [Leucobacter allii]|uniref:Uncharacterized protein n=1 Tax=Leucobacter allii TaxID=2932247 RepID=A0ABY4FJ30_9MICO|nr:hypothetical protein [Leucobacter allii]UOQ56695.1 hypothetical protein MUN78_13605 [Leucobacter allii]